MTKVKIIGPSGTVRVAEANLCMNSGIVKFINPEGNTEFAHVTAIAIQNSRLIEILEEVAAPEIELKVAPAPRSASTKNHNKKK